MIIARSMLASIRGVNVWRTLVLPGLLGSTALAIAVVGAILIGGGRGIDGVNGFVEVLSGSSSSFLGGSAPAGELYEQFGLTAQHMAEEANRLLTRSSA